MQGARLFTIGIHHHPPRIKPIRLTVYHDQCYKGIKTFKQIVVLWFQKNCISKCYTLYSTSSITFVLNLKDPGNCSQVTDLLIYVFLFSIEHVVLLDTDIDFMSDWFGPPLFRWVHG